MNAAGAPVPAHPDRRHRTAQFWCALTDRVQGAAHAARGRAARGRGRTAPQRRGRPQAEVHPMFLQSIVCQQCMPESTARAAYSLACILVEPACLAGFWYGQLWHHGELCPQACGSRLDLIVTAAHAYVHAGSCCSASLFPVAFLRPLLVPLPAANTGARS